MNIGQLLKAEIARLSRKESRSQVDPLRKTSTAYRRDIAALKRKVTELQKQVALLLRGAARSQAGAATKTVNGTVRFVPRGLRSQRKRLGLSASDFGKLVGVSSQSVYNWEHGLARPRPEQFGRLVAIRGLGKREAAARLEQLGAQPTSRRLVTK